MKTNSISRKKEMIKRTLILLLALMPALCFALVQKKSNLLPAFIDHYATQEEEKMETWMTDVTTWSNEVSENIESEEEMAVEKWMLDVNDTIWHADEAEEEIQIEEWMGNPSSWPVTK